MRRAVAISVVLSAGSAPAMADEQPRDPVAAEASFSQGVQALRAGDWTAACAKFRKSMALEPAVSTQVKIARCLEHEGRLAAAWYAYQQALKLNREPGSASEARRQELEDLIRAAVAEIEPRVPKLRVAVRPQPPGLVVRRDGEPMPLAALGDALPIDAGEHEIVAVAPGHIEQRRRVSIEAGRLVDVALELEAAAAPGPPATEPGRPAPPPSEAPARSAALPPSTAPAEDANAGVSWRTAGFVVVGAGVVGLGVGAFFGLRTLSLVADSEPHCDDTGCDDEGVELRDRAGSAQTIGIVAAAVGGAALGTGIVLVAAAPSRERAAGRAPSLLLRAHAGGLSGTVAW
jgi:hypothetical protein